MSPLGVEQLNAFEELIVNTSLFEFAGQPDVRRIITVKIAIACVAMVFGVIASSQSIADSGLPSVLASSTELLSPGVVENTIPAGADDLERAPEYH